MVKAILNDALSATGFNNTEQAIDSISQSTLIGTISTANSDAYYGINHRQAGNVLQMNKDRHGLSFFTRPDLNLLDENIRYYRKFIPLLTTNQNTISRILRCYLSPRLDRFNISTPFVDPLCAFIPILTNTLVSINGWPELAVQTHTTPSGMYKEEHSIVDSTAEIYSAYDITANFRNITGDPISPLFAYWVQYSSLVKDGTIVPFPDNNIGNIIDYNTRIYRLVMNSANTHVQKISICGAAFPINSSIGAAFDFEEGKPMNDALGEITINFKANGFEWNDPIIIHEFNDVVCRANAGMKDANRNYTYTKVPIEVLGLFNHRGYPRINPETWELEWYVDKQVYNSVIKG